MAETSSGYSDNKPTTSTESRSKRKTRNESEKRRRDAFNRLIGELTGLVAGDERRMDKSTVLKCAIDFLKQRNRWFYFLDAKPGSFTILLLLCIFV
ncbi:unnamed protein product [Gongylonema pulchrum]|uniref:BHLH domain-containing protein n=1 Tax=Gongylonema pulchrum TaxID=637853 RepID=A0A183D1K1_9BILA|nr:unnamed protein product [Gongylonema pulchrum]